MNGKRRVACFFTAGYTELNAMKFFGKINDKVEYIQSCPIGSRKSKRAIQNRHINQIVKEQNGMTGEKLIEFVVDFIGGKPPQLPVSVVVSLSPLAEWGGVSGL